MREAVIVEKTNNPELLKDSNSVIDTSAVILGEISDSFKDKNKPLSDTLSILDKSLQQLHNNEDSHINVQKLKSQDRSLTVDGKSKKYPKNNEYSGTKISSEDGISISIFGGLPNPISDGYTHETFVKRQRGSSMEQSVVDIVSDSTYVTIADSNKSLFCAFELTTDNKIKLHTLTDYSGRSKYSDVDIEGVVIADQEYAVNKMREFARGMRNQLIK